MRTRGNMLKAWVPIGSSEPVDLLEGLPWIQGTNTTMSFPGDRVRATSTIGNPRVYKTVPGLTNGATYAFTGTIWKNTASLSVRMRVSTAADLPSGDIYELIEGGIDHVFLNQTFVMSGTTAHIGIVAVVSNTGEQSEISAGLSMIAL